MALVIVQKTSAESSDSTATSTLVFNNNVTPGNLLVCFLSNASSTSPVVTAGWTLLESVGNTTNAAYSQYKIVTAADVGTTFVVTQQNGANKVKNAVLYEISGADAVNPIHAHSRRGATGTALTTNSHTPTVFGTLPLAFFTQVASGNAWSLPGWNEDGTTTATSPAVEWQERALTTDTSTAMQGSVTSSANAAYSAFIVLVAPQKNVGRPISSVHPGRSPGKGYASGRFIPSPAHGLSNPAAIVLTASDSIAAPTDTASRGAQALSRTGSDAISAPTDSATKLSTFQRTAGDGQTQAIFTADSASQKVGLSRTASDTVAAPTDAAVRGSQAFARTGTDTVAAPTDAAVRNPAALSRTATDDTSSFLSTISDAPTRIVGTARSASDSIAAPSDAAVRAAAAIIRTSADSIAAPADSANHATADVRTVSDAIPVPSDAAVRSAVGKSRTASDSIGAPADSAASSFTVKLVSQYAALVLSDTPLVYYRLGDASSSPTADDDSGNGLDGTYGAGVMAGVRGLILDVDTAAKFPGTAASKLTLARNALVEPSSLITVGCWVKLAALPASGQKFTIASYGGPTGTEAWKFYIDSSGRVQFQAVVNGVSVHTSNGSGSLQIGVSAYVNAVYDGSSLRSRLNGAQVANLGSLSGSLNGYDGSTGLTIGMNPDGTDALNATLDEFFILSTALNVPKSTDRYNAGTSGPLFADASISSAVSQSLSAAASISAKAISSLGAAASVQATAVSSLPAVASVRAVALKTLSAGASISAPVRKSLSASARISAKVTTSLQAAMSISAQATPFLNAFVTVKAKTRVHLPAQASISAKASLALPAAITIQAVATQSLSASAWIAGVPTQSLAAQMTVVAQALASLGASAVVSQTARMSLRARLHVAEVATKALTASMSVSAIARPSLAASARVSASVRAVLGASAHVSASPIQTLSAFMRVGALRTKRLSAFASVAGFGHASIAAAVTVIARRSVALPAAAAISAKTSKSLQAKAAISARRTATLAASASLSARLTRSLSAQAWVGIRANASLPASAVVAASVARTLPAFAVVAGFGRASLSAKMVVAVFIKPTSVATMVALQRFASLSAQRRTTTLRSAVRFVAILEEET